MMSTTSSSSRVHAVASTSARRAVARRAAPRAAVEPPSSDTAAEAAAGAEAPPPQQQQQQDILDPADGSVQYAAPQGDAGTEMLGNFFSTFKTGRASETINGRAAQMGFLAAAYSELTTGTSLREQLFVTRNIDTALVHKTINYPQAGFFMALATVVLVTA